MCQFSRMPERNRDNANQQFPEAITLGSIPLAKGLDQEFHIYSEDLNEHFYIIGRSGTGKTNLLTELAIADMELGNGLCFIDPIGTAAESLLSHIPTQCVPTGRDTSRNSDTSKSRGETRSNRSKREASFQNETGEGEREGSRESRDKDVIYIDCADTEFPIGINPLYNIAPEDRPRAVSDILQMFASIWHDTGWGPRMESIFRAALHTLIENPHCMRPSLLSVFRLLLDEDFRKRAKTDIANRQLLDWWDFRFDRHDLHERTRREWVEPVLNKIDALSLDPLIRNIIGQPRCSLDFEEIIRRKQILVVNLNQNKIGLDNAAFIGMLIISRIRQAAAKVGNPTQPFTLSIDEAHSFPTMELTKIITQGRHSGLFARIAHQHLDQFDPKISSVLRNGCGSLAVFAVGNKDAEAIVDDLEAQHRERSLDVIRNLGNGEALLRLTKDGKPQAPASSPIAIRRRDHGRAKSQSARNFTRERFGTERLRAEYQILASNGGLKPEEKIIWQSKFSEVSKARTKVNHQNRTARVKRKAEEASDPDDLKALGDLIFSARA